MAPARYDDPDYRAMSPVDSPPAAASPPAAVERVSPANKLFLVTMLLIVTLGAAAQHLSIWPGLIFTEIYLILFPAWRFGRVTGSCAEALRLEWVGLAPCLLGLLSGIAALPLAGIAGCIGAKILGYDFPVPDNFWPATPKAVAAYILGSVILAPLCEEMVFRGYILRAYERAGWRPPILVLSVAALFTAWHLSPARAPGVAVLAIVLTYIAWRTGSVWPSVAAHMGANSGAAAVVLIRGQAQAGSDAPARVLLLVAIPAIVILALCLRPISRRPAPSPVAHDAAPPREWWPLWVAGMIVLLAAAAEVGAVFSRSIGRD